MTICPAQLVASLGGADRLRATRAFSDVRDLADGAALLQATPDPAATASAPRHAC